MLAQNSFLFIVNKMLTEFWVTIVQIFAAHSISTKKASDMYWFRKTLYLSFSEAVLGFLPFFCWKQLSLWTKNVKYISIEEDCSHVWINVFLEWATWPRPNGVWSQRNRGSLNTNSIITTSVISTSNIFTSLFWNYQKFCQRLRPTLDEKIFSCS